MERFRLNAINPNPNLSIGIMSYPRAANILWSKGSFIYVYTCILYIIHNIPTRRTRKIYRTERAAGWKRKRTIYAMRIRFV